MSKTHKVLINNYNKTRNITRTIYLYGIYNNEKMYGVSQRKLSNEKARVKALYKDNYKSEYYKNRKYIGLVYDKICHTKNFLANSYFIKTFTRQDFILYFSILQILNDKPNSIEEILFEFDKKRCEVDTISKSTFDRKINEMQKEGILQKIQKGNKFLYKLEEEFFGDFSKEERKKILYATMFFNGITSYKVPGYYLLETLKNYSEINENDFYDNNSNYTDWFSYTHSFIQNILDEIILFEIEENKCVKIINSNMECDFYYTNPIIDNNYGRIYVMGKVIENNKITDKDIIFRLDRIKETKLLKKVETTENISIKDRKMWCSSFNPNIEDIKYEKVEAIFYIDEEEKYYLVDDIKREKKWGVFEKIEENKFLFSIEVSDPMEMLPWFRSYEGYVVVLHEKIRNILKNEREKLLEMYK